MPREPREGIAPGSRECARPPPAHGDSSDVPRRSGGSPWHGLLPECRDRESLARGSRQPRHLIGAGPVAEGELRLEAELARLLQHEATGRVHAAVEDHIGVAILDAREDRLEIRFLVGGALATYERDFR